MKENIKQILREDTGGKPTKLSVFDFDGTTVDTGTPDSEPPTPGIKQYETAKWSQMTDKQKKDINKLWGWEKGNKLSLDEKIRLKELEGLFKWPHVGWWGRKESLDMSVFNFKAKPEVKGDYMKERSNPDTMVISLTGRRPKLGNEVKAILDANGYKFDAYLYNYGADTLSNKLEQLGKILSETPSIVSVELWDDRLDHFKTFQQWGKGLVDKGRLEHFKLHKVHNPQWTK